MCAWPEKGGCLVKLGWNHDEEDVLLHPKECR